MLRKCGKVTGGRNVMLSNRLVQVSQQPNNCFFDVKIKTGGKKKKKRLAWRRRLRPTKPSHWSRRVREFFRQSVAMRPSVTIGVLFYCFSIFYSSCVDCNYYKWVVFYFILSLWLIGWVCCFAGTSINFKSVRNTLLVTIT